MPSPVEENAVKEEEVDAEMEEEDVREADENAVLPFFSDDVRAVSPVESGPDRGDAGATSVSGQAAASGDRLGNAPPGLKREPSQNETGDDESRGRVELSSKNPVFVETIVQACREARGVEGRWVSSIEEVAQNVLDELKPLGRFYRNRKSGEGKPRRVGDEEALTIIHKKIKKCRTQYENNDHGSSPTDADLIVGLRDSTKYQNMTRSHVDHLLYGNNNRSPTAIASEEVKAVKSRGGRILELVGERYQVVNDDTAREKIEENIRKSLAAARRKSPSIIVINMKSKNYVATVEEQASHLAKEHHGSPLSAGKIRSALKEYFQKAGVRAFFRNAVDEKGIACGKALDKMTKDVRKQLQNLDQRGCDLLENNTCGADGSIPTRKRKSCEGSISHHTPGEKCDETGVHKKQCQRADVEGIKDNVARPGDGGGAAIDPSHFALLSRISVGTRLSVYWPKDDEFYVGTVVLHLGTHKYEIAYDDGDVEELNLANERIRILDGIVLLSRRDARFRERVYKIWEVLYGKDKKGGHSNIEDFARRFLDELKQLGDLYRKVKSEGGSHLHQASDKEALEFIRNDIIRGRTDYFRYVGSSPEKGAGACKARKVPPSYTKKFPGGPTDADLVIGRRDSQKYQKMTERYVGLLLFGKSKLSPTTIASEEVNAVTSNGGRILELKEEQYVTVNKNEAIERFATNIQSNLTNARLSHPEIVVLNLKSKAYKEKINEKAYADHNGSPLSAKKIGATLMEQFKQSGVCAFFRNAVDESGITEGEALEKIVKDIQKKAQDLIDDENESLIMNNDEYYSSTRKRRSREDSHIHCPPGEYIFDYIKRILPAHGWKVRRKVKSALDIYVAHREVSVSENTKGKPQEFSGWSNILDELYRCGFYEEHVVGTEEGKQWLDQAGILDKPYSIFREELIQMRGQQKGEQDQIHASNNLEQDLRKNRSSAREMSRQDRKLRNEYEGSSTSPEKHKGAAIKNDSTSKLIKMDNNVSQRSGTSSDKAVTSETSRKSLLAAPKVREKVVQVYRRIRATLSKTEHHVAEDEGKDELMEMKKDLYSHLNKWLKTRYGSVLESDLDAIQTLTNEFESVMSDLEKENDDLDRATCLSIIEECKRKFLIVEGSV